MILILPKWRWILLFTLCLLLSNFILAQRTISGTVTSSDLNEALIGVTVSLKSDQSGTVTDFEGKYSIEVKDDTEILVFSYIGYITQEIQVNNQTTIDVVLEQEKIWLW